MASLLRRAGAEILALIKRALDPGAAAGRVLFYSKDDGPTTELYAQTSDGEVYQMTPNGGAGGAAALFGTGGDGNVTLGAGTTTITRDMFYDNLTVPAGSTLDTDGFHVFCKTSLVLDGEISRAPTAGGNGTAVAAGTAGQGRTGTNRVLGGTSANGGAGGAPAGAGVGGGNVSGAPPPPGNPGNGGAGGAGAAAAGPAGTATPSAASNGGLQLALWAIQGRNNIAIASLNSGAGGGGGGGGVGAGGGGGGGGGTFVVVCASRITGAGAIRADGGAGGNAFATGVISAGGGGGGGGGVAVVVINRGSFPTTTANGGAPGAPGNAGAAGTIGQAGQVLQFELSNP